MTLNSINSTATQGLYAAQAGMNAVSDNITNVNTTGYVRKVVNQNSTATGGIGDGVATSSVALAANRFLENASFSASASVGSASITSSLLGQAQSLLGDPSSSTGFFNQFGAVLSSFSAAANDPASSLSATDAVNQVSQFLTQAQSIGTSLGALSTQADTNIGSDVTEINQLLTQISSLNSSITTATAGGGDPTNSQNAQNSLVTQLSSLIDVKVAQTATGGVNLTTSSGQTLVGQMGAASLSYSDSTDAASQVTVTQPGGPNQPVPLQIASGEVQGLLTLRNQTLPGVQDQLSEYVTQAVNALNKAHNGATSVPAPQTLTGQPVATDIPTALSGFTGKTNIAVVNSGGVVQQQVAIDFDAGTITPAGGTALTFTPSTFVSTLNTALGGTATVSVSSTNALSISATTTGNGVALADDPTTPSSKNGFGFSQYFGLNNLVSTTGVTNYQTGLSLTDANGFGGGTLTLRLTNGSGNQITDVPVSIPSGGTMSDVVNALNATTGGVGLYGQFGLDSTGELSFTANTPGAASVSVVSDTTQWTGGTASMSQLFGIGDTGRADRINGFSVRSDIAASPSNIAFATLNLTAAAGTAALAIGDGSGAQAIANAGATTMSFDSAGGLSAVQTSVTQYGSQLAGQLGAQANAATTAQTNATAVQTEAESRRQSVEGVNLDQELVNLTTYQQAYSASSRLITATKDMFTALMSM